MEKLIKKPRSPKKLQAAEMLAVDISKQEVANRVGISRQQIYNWLKDPDYKAYVEERTQAYVQDIQGSIEIAGKVAIETLMVLMLAGGKQAAKACATVLKYVRSIQANDAANLNVKIDYDPTKVAELVARIENARNNRNNREGSRGDSE